MFLTILSPLVDACLLVVDDMDASEDKMKCTADSVRQSVEQNPHKRERMETRILGNNFLCFGWRETVEWILLFGRQDTSKTRRVKEPNWLYCCLCGPCGLNIALLLEY